jgi:MoaA/NifB/PqqE/SkfB family radical SAM enzyme
MKKIRLFDELVMRKEFFGCLIYNLKESTYHQFNSAGSELLYFLREPKDFSDIITHFREKEGYEIDINILKKFINRCIEEKTLIEIDSNERSKNLIYFYDINTFRTDCLHRPTSVTIYITFKCTKKCRHCVTNSNPAIDESKELSVEEWKGILQYLRENGVIYLVFTGGEPLLKEGILELLSYATDLRFNFALLTDFDYLNRDNIRELKKFEHLDYLQVSLDGATKETHDFLRGEGSFERAMQRLALLQKEGIEYGICTTVHKGNLKEIPQIVKLYQQYGASTLWLNPLAPFGRGKQLSQYVLSEEELKQLSQLYLRFTQEGEINPGNDYWIFQSYQEAEDKNFNPLKDAPLSVSLGIYNFSIGAYGDCYLDSKMKAEEMLRLGNILNETIDEMWNDKRLHSLRSQYKLGNFSFRDLQKLKIQQAH